MVSPAQGGAVALSAAVQGARQGGQLLLRVLLHRHCQQLTHRLRLPPANRRGLGAEGPGHRLPIAQALAPGNSDCRPPDI